MSIISAGKSGGYVGPNVGDIGHSLRFRASASAYLSRTPSVTSNQKTFTYSGWIKRGAMPSGKYSIFNCGTKTVSQNIAQIVFTADYTFADRISFEASTYGSTNYIQGYTSGVWRDPSSWYHIVVAVDTTQATNSNGVKIWINGVQQTLTFPTYTQNYNTAINTTAIHDMFQDRIGTGFLDGYLSRVAFVDGQALTPSSFGYLNTEINEWVSKSQAQVKAVVDAGGTNSFMLDFDNGTSLTTLGYDKSAKGNNWTLTNHSLTAGATYDWMNDVPGNSYATLNPLRKYGADDGLIYANLHFQFASSATGVTSTISVGSGKWYFESTLLGNITANGYSIGVGLSDPAIAINYTGTYGYTDAGNKITNGTLSAYGAAIALNDVVGVALDLDAGTLTFYKNGVSQGVAFSGLTGQFSPWGQAGASGTGAAINFGQYPFAYTPPTGYKALCQRNLPDPAILNPEKHFDVKTRVGTAASYSVTGIGFQPDFVWVKSRGRAIDHALYDAVRGATKDLVTNSTAAETTQATGVTSFNADGYSGGVLDKINGTTATNSFVDWMWKAGGAGFTNTAGTITSTVSANTAAGFSIVTYTGTGANATVGHGLGVAPKMIIIKTRTGAATQWQVGHQGLNGGVTPWNYIIELSNTGAQSAASTRWQNTAPTSSVFSIGTDTVVNTNTVSHVAYCFSEIPGYSKFGSYTGNGSADGPFVHCGFKPKLVIMKNISVTTNWYMQDGARKEYNVNDLVLYPNSSGAEITEATVDFLSNGFKIRVNNTSNNGLGNIIVFMAFADVPAKYANAR